VDQGVFEMMEPHLKESEVDGDHDKEGNNDGL